MRWLSATHFFLSLLAIVDWLRHIITPPYCHMLAADSWLADGRHAIRLNIWLMMVTPHCHYAAEAFADTTADTWHWYFSRHCRASCDTTLSLRHADGHWYCRLPLHTTPLIGPLFFIFSLSLPFRHTCRHIRHCHTDGCFRSIATLPVIRLQLIIHTRFSAIAAFTHYADTGWYAAIAIAIGLVLAIVQPIDIATDAIDDITYRHCIHMATWHAMPHCIIIFFILRLPFFSFFYCHCWLLYWPLLITSLMIAITADAGQRYAFHTLAISWWLRYRYIDIAVG